MTALLFSAPTFRPLSLSGGILPGAYVRFYATGTTTEVDTYADSDLQTALSNPVVANDDGQFVPIYLDRSVSYRAQIYDADDNLLLDVDPLGTNLDHPPGTVVLFYGDATARDAAYPTSLWQVLNGDNGTPDGRDLFLRLAGGSLAAGDTGGTASVTSGSGGSHDHGAATGSHTLTTAQIPSHRHAEGGTQQGTTPPDAVEAEVVSHEQYEFDAFTSVHRWYTEYAGGGEGHTHSISSASDHTHSVATVPPYIVLWALMRRAA